MLQLLIVFVLCFFLLNHRICREETIYPPDKSTAKMRSHLHKVHREIYDTDKGFIPRPSVPKPLGN